MKETWKGLRQNQEGDTWNKVLAPRGQVCWHQKDKESIMKKVESIHAKRTALMRALEGKEVFEESGDWCEEAMNRVMREEERGISEVEGRTSCILTLHPPPDLICF